MTIQNDSTVILHYTGTLDDGTEFDSSRGRDPLEFIMGQEMLIPGFESALVGRTKGDKFVISVEPEEGYGEYSEELVFEVPLEEVPDEITPEVGMVLELNSEEGDVEVAIIDVTETSVLLDANHALAGEVLTFDIEIIDVK